MINIPTNINIIRQIELTTPEELKEEIPLNYDAACTVIAARKTIENILTGKDERMLALIGPCSTHNPDEAIEYASGIPQLQSKVSNSQYIAMRACIEKPRSGSDWPGMLDDPYLDNSGKKEIGLRMSRRMLNNILSMNVPIAMEFVNIGSANYFDDMVCFAWIGARSSDSMHHRKFASGLTMPVGLKNNVYGDLKAVIKGMENVLFPGYFPGPNEHNKTCTIYTRGNKLCRIILRGGNGEPNYKESKIKEVQGLLAERQFPPQVIVDCSHGNSGKDYKKQPGIFIDVIKQRKNGNKNIVGTLLESYLEEDKQEFSYNPKIIRPRISITDSCISWKTTEEIILEAHRLLKD